jgi:flap endonuclease-1
MGLKGVCALIQKLAPSGITNNHIDTYSKSIVAIDTGILLHRFSVSSENTVTCFAKICIKYLSCNIRPVFIFDGPSPKCKQDIIAKRIYKKQKLLRRIIELEIKKESILKINKLKSKLVHVTREDRVNVFNFLSSAGFDVFESPGEAETMCAFLQHKGIVDFVYTDDSDAFALGCKKILRNFKCGRFDQVNMDVVLSKLNLTMTQFVDMCILCGCDYCPSIPYVNYTLAYNLIAESGNIESVLSNNDLKIPDSYQSKVEDARSAFTDFSIFKIVELKRKLIVTENVNTFSVKESLIHRLAILAAKYNRLNCR